MGAGARIIWVGRGLLLLVILYILLPNVFYRLRPTRFQALLHPELKSDLIEVFEHRFDDLRNDLPEDAVLGYVSDSWDITRFMKTQYALAPKLLLPMTTVRRPDFRTQEQFSRKLRSPVRSIEGLQMVTSEGLDDPTYVVGVLTRDRTIADMKERFSLKTIRDYGDGIVLFAEQDR